MYAAAASISAKRLASYSAAALAVPRAAAAACSSRISPAAIRTLASSSSAPSSSSSSPPEWARKPPQPDDPTNPSSQPYLDPTIKIPRPQRPASEPTDQKRARLLWASRKRGILESDLLMSTFASEYLQDMTRAELDEYDQFLEENDWDIYYWVTGAKGKIVPERVSGISIWPKLVEHALNTQRKILRMPDLERRK